MNANTKQSNRKLRASDKRILWCHSKINSISIELSNWILLPIFWSHSFHPILFCSNFSLAFSLLFVHIRRTYTSGKKIHHNSNSFPYKSLYSFCEFFGEKKFFFSLSIKRKRKAAAPVAAMKLIYPREKNVILISRTRDKCEKMCSLLMFSVEWSSMLVQFWFRNEAKLKRDEYGGVLFFRLAIYSQLIRIGGTYWLLRFMDIDLNAPCAVVSRLPKIQSNSHFPFDMWRRMCNIPNILPNKPHTRTHHSLCKRHLLSFNRFLICLMEKVDKWIWSERLLCEKRVNM